MSNSIKIKQNAYAEKTNYSHYKANNIVEVGQYISEQDIYVQALVQGADRGVTSLLIAPTGSGKTYSVINTIKELSKTEDIKAIFIVPNSIQVNQISSKYGIGGAYGDISVREVVGNNSIVAMTWDKFGQLDKTTVSDFIVFVDEIHQTYVDMFRYKKISKLYDNLEACKGQVHITATPNKLDFNRYGYITEYKQTEQTDYNVKLYNNIDNDKILSIARSSKKFLLLKNDIKFLNFVKESLPSKKIDVLDSNSRYLTDVYEMIVDKSSIGDFQGVCTTTMLTAGVDINDSDITDIIVVGEKDIATIKQFVARARCLKKCNVHIFNDYPREKETEEQKNNKKKKKSEEMPFKESKVYTIEHIINLVIEEVTEVVESLNRLSQRKSRLTTMEIKPSLTTDNKEFYWHKELKEYVINEEFIRHNEYTKYYEKADIQSFKVLLEEYFSNVRIVEIKKSDNKAFKKFAKTTKEQKEQAFAYCLDKLPQLVGCVEVLTDKVNYQLERYYQDNNIDIVEYKQSLEDIGIREILAISGMPKIMNIYTKYVIEESLTYNLAFYLATLSNRARGKFWSSLKNIVFRKKFDGSYEQLPIELIELRLFKLIDETFKIGTNYTKESLEFFTEWANQIICGLKLTENKLAEILHTMYKIESSQTRSVNGIDFLFKQNLYPNGLTVDKKVKKFNTIIRHLEVKDIVENAKMLTDIDEKVMNTYVDNSVKSIKVTQLLEDTDIKMSIEEFNDIMNL